MGLDLWKDLVPNLLKGKEKLEFEDINKEYNPWIINQAMSYYMDTILFAAEMNKYPSLSKQMQYDFYFNAIKKRSRQYSPWLKKEKHEDLELAKRYFNVSIKKAKDIINILTEEQLDMIRDEMDTGGVNENGKSTRKAKS